MSAERVYFDYNATAPLLPAARDAMTAAMALPGNASSVHREGRLARACIEQARAEVAALVGAPAEAVVFTSGGTEAANLALTPQLFTDADKRPFSRLLIAAGEHACVLQGHRFRPEQVVSVPLNSEGVVDLTALEGLIERFSGERLLLALQLANNETGAVQPLAQAAVRIHAAGGALVCDAVQAAGRIEIDFNALGADALILSAHKFGGPKGVGALVLDRRRWHLAAPLVAGGGQERGARGGTENIAAIAGFGAAAAAAQSNLSGEARRLSALRDELTAGILAIDAAAAIFAQGAPRLPNTLAFALPGLTAETLLIALDLAGFAVSSGAACSSGKVRRSHVLTAMGVDWELAAGALRLSLGHATQARETAAFLAALALIVARMRGRRAQMAA